VKAVAVPFSVKFRFKRNVSEQNRVEKATACLPVKGFRVKSLFSDYQNSQ
jgi:hypothetical protein